MARTTYMEGDHCISISDRLNRKYHTHLPVLYPIIHLSDSSDNLRTELRIPDNAIVYGRYGPYDKFNIGIMHKAIREHIDKDDCYFLFMNTKPFIDHPRVIYIPNHCDKTIFINTCDVMVHANSFGEPFDVPVAEFSTKNKPIITCPSGDAGQVDILGEKAIQYKTKDELLQIFNNIRNIIHSRNDWNAYSFCEPDKIMNDFANIIK
jgi:hypothetical protein